MNLEDQKKYIKNHLNINLEKYIDSRITKDVLNNVIETTKKVLESSNKINNINDHVEIIVKHNELDPRELIIRLIPKDQIGEHFLKGNSEDI